MLEQHKIEPAPVVFELDTDPHGQELQDALLKLTGRRSVPNCIFCGTSNGGGSEMAALHSNDNLAETIFKNCAGRKVKVDGRSK